MERIKPLIISDFTEKQRLVYEKIVRSRPSVAGPFLAWLKSPELADKAQALGAFVRFHSSLPPKLSELAILVVARHWDCRSEWSIHLPFALKAGLEKNQINALNRKETLQFSNPEESILVTFIKQLLENHTVDDTTYRQAAAVFDDRTMVELTGLVGYYSLVALTLNAFQIADTSETPLEGMELIVTSD